MAARPSVETAVLQLEAVNHGPGKVFLDTAIFSDGSPKKNGYHMMSAYTDYPENLERGAFHNSQMRAPLDETDRIILHFPITDEFLSRVGPVKAGFRDTYSRVHLCRKRDAKHFKRALKNLREAAKA